jgi:hypothetical protein
MLSSLAPTPWAGSSSAAPSTCTCTSRRTSCSAGSPTWPGPAVPRAGLAGFALKSHYVPTAERAAVLNEAMDGAVAVIGTLTLNAAVGG